MEPAGFAADPGHGPRGSKKPLPHGPVRLPGGRDTHRAMRLWHAGPGALSLDELWRAYLARSGIEHAFKLLKGAFGRTAAQVRTPEQADRWARSS